MKHGVAVSAPWQFSQLSFAADYATTRGLNVFLALGRGAIMAAKLKAFSVIEVQSE